MLIKEIQELINSINHETSMGECYFSSGATIDGIKEAIVLSTIDKLVIENDLFYCNEEEVSRFFEMNCYMDIVSLLKIKKLFLKNLLKNV